MVVALVALLAGLSFGTGLLIFRHFRSTRRPPAGSTPEYSADSTIPGPAPKPRRCCAWASRCARWALPLVVTDRTGRVTAAANLPFEAPLDDPRVKLYAERLDRQNPPISDAAIGTVHYGPLPAQRNLIALAVLQGLTIAVMVAVAVFAYRSAMAAQRDRLWVAMAREAAHQMGTPLTSLQGWIERVRSRATPPPDLADHLSADAERLDRVAQRFERIGNPAKREPIGLGALADRVAGYFRPRLPRHANMIDLRVEARRRRAHGAGRSGAPGMGAGGPGQERNRCAAGAARHDYPAGRRRGRHGRHPGHR